MSKLDRDLVQLPLRSMIRSVMAEWSACKGKPSASKPSPWPAWLWGPPGVGKSSAAQLLATYYNRGVEEWLRRDDAPRVDKKSLVWAEVISLPEFARQWDDGAINDGATPAFICQGLLARKIDQCIFLIVDNVGEPINLYPERQKRWRSYRADAINKGLVGRNSLPRQLDEPAQVELSLIEKALTRGHRPTLFISSKSPGDLSIDVEHYSEDLLKRATAGRKLDASRLPTWEKWQEDVHAGREMASWGSR